MTIREAREEAGFTQKQVQELIGVPIRTLQNWENGVRVCPPYVEKLIVDKINNLKKVKRYLIVWEDQEGFHQDYIQALSPDHGIEILGIRQKQVREVAVCLPEYCY